MRSVGERIGGHRLLGQLSKGRTGELYVIGGDAMPDPQSLYALKIFSGVRDPDALCAQVLTSAVPVDHPSFARIHGAFVHEGRACVVTDYVEGETLASAMKIDPAGFAGLLGVALTIEMAKAFAAIQEDGFIHGDLCPQNVILGYEGKLTIVAFGLALAETTALRDQAHVRGHFGYMSPERAAGKELDVRTDTYSLAAMLWEMLMSAPAIKGDSDEERRRNAIKPKISPLPVKGRVSEAVNELVMSALAVDKKERLASAKVFAEGLRTQKSIRLQGFKRDTEVDKLMARFSHRARAARLMKERWRSLAGEATCDLPLMATDSDQPLVRAPSSAARLPLLDAASGQRVAPDRMPSPGRLPRPGAPLHRPPSYRGTSPLPVPPPRAPSRAASATQLAAPPPPPPPAPVRSPADDGFPVSFLAEVELLRTDDLPASSKTADLPRHRERKHLSFVGGLALIIFGTLLLMLSTLYWGPGPKGMVLEIEKRIGYASDRIMNALVSSTDD